MKRRLLTAFVAVAALLPGSVDAQGVYNGNPALYSQFRFVDSSPAVNGVDGVNVRVGPYVGDFADDAAGVFNIYCVDYLHWADGSWADVNVSQLSGSLADTRLGMSTPAVDALGRYQQSAYLSSLFESWSTDARFSGVSQRTAFSAIHSAIWYTTSGIDLGNDGSAVRALRTALLSTVATDAASVNLDEWYVITDANATDGYGQGRDVGNIADGLASDGLGQEFLVRAVPEPGTFLLLLTGMVMLVAVNRRRMADLL